jgi:predicted transcriptional regulator
MYSLTNEDDIRQTKVSSFMTACEFISKKATSNPCVQLDEDEDVLSAIKVMNEAGVNHLLVSGSKGEPVGMVSSLEIIKLIAS